VLKHLEIPTYNSASHSHTDRGHSHGHTHGHEHHPNDDQTSQTMYDYLRGPQTR
jgi:hypothetical protein